MQAKLKEQCCERISINGEGGNIQRLKSFEAKRGSTVTTNLGTFRTQKTACFTLHTLNASPTRAADRRTSWNFAQTSWTLLTSRKEFRNSNVIHTKKA